MTSCHHSEFFGTYDVIGGMVAMAGEKGLCSSENAVGMPANIYVNGKDAVVPSRNRYYSL